MKVSELISSDEVREAGLEVLKLADEKGWSPALTLIVCRELARFHEAQGVKVVLEGIENPLN
jgi:hypothetical protein